MALLHLRVICPDDLVDTVLAALRGQPGAVGPRVAGTSADGTEVQADLARESVDGLLNMLRDRGVIDRGMVSLEPLDTTLGTLADRAERDAPGEAADALIWDELASRTREDSALTGTFLAFMVLATILGAIGVVTRSPITIVGAMVVGPEFGPLAAVGVGIMRRNATTVRRAGIALAVGFVVAIAVTAGLAIAARAAGLINPGDLSGDTGSVDFIYHPGWFSLITALVAGTAGMLSLTSSKSAALVGVFISVTTIPAAGNAAVGAVLDHWRETWLSLAQLGINLVGISAAGLITLWAMHRSWTLDRRRRLTASAA